MADENAPRRLTVHMEGSDEDGGDVRLSEFIEQLEAVKAALNGLVEPRPGIRVSYKVVALSHRSPAAVTLEEQIEAEMEPDEISAYPVPPASRFKLIRGGLYDSGGILVDRLNDMKAAATAPPKYIRYVSDMRPYLRLIRPLTHHMKRVVLEFDSKKVELTRTFPEHVKGLLGPDSEEVGTISGRLESVSLHGKKVFEIFPVAADIRVECRFTKRSELLDQVKEGLGKYVTVSGIVRFKNWDRLPHAVDAENIHVHKPTPSPTTLTDLLGSAKGLGDGMSSEEYLQKIRDDASEDEA